MLSHVCKVILPGGGKYSGKAQGGICAVRLGNLEPVFITEDAGRARNFRVALGKFGQAYCRMASKFNDEQHEKGRSDGVCRL